MVAPVAAMQPECPDPPAHAAVEALPLTSNQGHRLPPSAAELLQQAAKVVAARDKVHAAIQRQIALRRAVKAECISDDETMQLDAGKADAQWNQWVPRGMSKRLHTHVKRSRSSSSAPEPEWNEGIELQELRDQCLELRKELEPLHSQFNSEGIPNMQEKGERRRLAIALYEGNYGESMALLREQNKELVAVLRSQLVNTSPSTEQSLRKEENHINGILLDLSLIHI